MKKLILAITMIFILIILIGINFDSLFYINWNSKSCIDECQHRGYETGICKLSLGIEFGDVLLGGYCVVKDINFCANEEQCKCFCNN
jgi:hypothetical protein